MRKQQGRRAKEKARSVDESVQTSAQAMLDPATEVITVLTYGMIGDGASSRIGPYQLKPMAGFTSGRAGCIRALFLELHRALSLIHI